MLKVIFPNLSPAAAEFVAERFFDSKSSPELVEKLLTNKISANDFLILLKLFCEREFDSYCERQEIERAERRYEDDTHLFVG